jgi:hypothetical protein
MKILEITIRCGHLPVDAKQRQLVVVATAARLFTRAMPTRLFGRRDSCTKEANDADQI